MLAAGKAYESRLKELDAAIQAALKGPNAGQGQGAWSPPSRLPARPRSTTSPRMASTSSSRCSRKATSRTATARISRSTSRPPAPATRASRRPRRWRPSSGPCARRSMRRSRSATRRPSRSRTTRTRPRSSCRRRSRRTSTRPRMFVNKIEQMLGDATKPASTLPVAKLEAARSDWIKSRDTAIKEITDLSKAIVAAFAGETTQKEAVDGCRHEARRAPDQAADRPRQRAQHGDQGQGSREAGRPRRPGPGLARVASGLHRAATT